MEQPDHELQKRVCRACGRTYDYPVVKSRATRFHCETCAELPDAVRETFERMNRRIRELERRAAAKGAAAPGQTDGR